MKAWKYLRGMLLISGILVIILGISMLFTPLANIVALAFYIGLVMLFTGISEISSYFAEEKEMRSGWLLTGGILSVLFGLWTMFGNGDVVLSTIIPFVFAIWVMSGGITRIVGSFSLKKQGVKVWLWLLILGILGTLSGFILMFSPMLSAFIVSYMLAFMFITNGMNYLVLFWGMRKLKKLAENVTVSVEIE